MEEIVVLAFVILVFFILLKRKTAQKVKYPSEKSRSTVEYSSKEIIRCQLAGASHQNLNGKDRRISLGVGKLEPNNPVDRYAIAVYNDAGKKVGYFPKNNSRLHNTIKTQYNGELDLIVSVNYDREGERWWFVGNIIAPVLYKELEQKTVINLLFTFETEGYRFKRKNQSTDEAWQSLLIWEKVKAEADSINFDLRNYPEPDVSWLFKLSTDLLKNEDYNRLAYLSNFEYLFDKLKPVSAKNINKRINLAKEKVNKN